MPTLYDVGMEFARLETLLYEQGGEWTDETEQAFAALGALEADKVDAYHAVITNLTAHAAGCQDEAQRLQEKATIATNAAKRLKDRLKEYMELRGVEALQGDRWRAVIQRNGGRPPLTVLVPVEALPKSLVRIRLEPDTDLIREVIGTGQYLDEHGEALARLEPVGTHLRFR